MSKSLKTTEEQRKQMRLEAGATLKCGKEIVKRANPDLVNLLDDVDSLLADKKEILRQFAAETSVWTKVQTGNTRLQAVVTLLTHNLLHFGEHCQTCGYHRDEACNCGLSKAIRKGQEVLETK